MELEKELFNQISSALGAARPPAPAGSPTPEGQPEKRQVGRLAISAEVSLAPFGVVSPVSRRVKLRSISLGGAAVLDGLPHQAGEKLVLHLPKAEGDPIPIVCMVMNTRLLSSGEFRVGVQFLSRAEQKGVVMLR